MWNIYIIKHYINISVILLGTIGDKEYYFNQICYDNYYDRNLIVNFTYLDYVINIDISDASLTVYVIKCKEKMEECYTLLR